MPKELKVEDFIEAPAAVVWGILADFDAYPVWNPFITQIGGVLTAGSELRMAVQMPSHLRLSIRTRLLRVEPGREICWLGHLVRPGLFDGEHRLLIHSLSDSRVLFTQQEHYTGCLVPFLWPLFAPQTREAFQRMNLALKARAERLAASA